MKRKDSYLIKTTNTKLFTIETDFKYEKCIYGGYIVSGKDLGKLFNHYHSLITKGEVKSTTKSSSSIKENIFETVRDEKKKNVSPCETDDEVHPFTYMYYTTYGKGFLLKPYYGKKNKWWGYAGNKSTDYFYGGWWREDLGGWFFRKSLLHVLENNGALKQNIKTEKCYTRFQRCRC